MCCVPAPPTPSLDFSPSHHLLITYSHHPSRHLTCHLTRHLPLSPVFSYTTPACLVMCYARHSHVMHATMGSAQFFANLSSNCSRVVRQALPAIVAAHFGVVHELSICLDNFYDTLYFILQIIPYTFHPPSIRLMCHVQMFLENTYIPLWLNLV